MAFADHADEMHRYIYVDQSKELLKDYFCIPCDMHSGPEHHDAHGTDSETQSDKDEVDQIRIAYSVTHRCFPLII